MSLEHACPTPDPRDALKSRILPYMILSDASNPLTVPLPRHSDSNETPAQRAVRRFAVKGNAIITGGAGTLGLETARALLEHGSPGIALIDLAPSFMTSRNTINALQTDFPQAKIICVEADVTDEGSVETLVEQIASQLGSVDILLCFAGIVGCTHALEMTAEEWKRTIDINLSGSWFWAQGAARGGSIVFVASVSARRVNFPQPQVAYNASKAAVLQVKNSLAAEWARHGIRVNSISPGYMDTILNEGEGLAEARTMWMSRNPMGRMGDPTELAGVVVLLCSAAGRYINGADIVVDGGGSVF